MKRRNKTVSPDRTLRVRPAKRLVYRGGQWHLKTVGGDQTPEAAPSQLPIRIITNLLSFLTDALDTLLSVQDQILASIYSDLFICFDVLESAQLVLVDAIREYLQSFVVYEDSIRITVEVVLGRKLPYECPQDHSRMARDVRCDCGMTLIALGVIAAHVTEPAEIPINGYFFGLGVDGRPLAEEVRLTRIHLNPLTPVLAPLTVETVKE
jgi:hypothetical protein